MLALLFLYCFENSGRKSYSATLSKKAACNCNREHHILPSAKFLGQRGQHNGHKWTKNFHKVPEIKQGNVRCMNSHIVPYFTTHVVLVFFMFIPPPPRRTF